MSDSTIIGKGPTSIELPSGGGADTAEQVRDKLASLSGSNKLQAASSFYDNTTSGLTASETQAAIDEIEGRVDTVETDVATKQEAVTTTQGDIIVADVTGDAARLAIGTNGQVLTSTGTTASWETASLTDEKVKVSANDTTDKFLEDAISITNAVNTTDILESSVLNEGVNESIQIQLDETKIDHDVLTNFVANEHIDHSSLNITTAADSGLSGGGDLTASRTLVVNISGTTEETIVASDDELLIYDTSAGALRRMSRSNLLAGVATPSVGDISETSFSFANNQVAAADVTGFDLSLARGFEALISVEIDATANLYEQITLKGIKRDSDFQFSQESIGDDSGIDFSITAGGQVQYTSGNEAGFVSGSIKFRVTTTTA